MPINVDEACRLMTIAANELATFCTNLDCNPVRMAVSGSNPAPSRTRCDLLPNES